MKIIEHWLVDAQRIVSPNYDARPDGQDISLLVIHAISLPPGEFGGDWITQLFTNNLDPEAHPYFKTIQELNVSAHVLITRAGETIQYVPFDQRAWHAGESCFEGRSCCNDFSIGIELEGTEEIPYTDRQYETLSKLIGTLLDTYPKLSVKRITGHSDIAPGRKQDPGPSFVWSRFYAMLDENMPATKILS